jgi:hypothetical protein
MLFLPWVILLSAGLFLLTEKPKEEKTPEQELEDAITNTLLKVRGMAQRHKPVKFSSQHC